MNIWNNEQAIKEAVESSRTYDEVLNKLGLTYFTNYGRIVQWIQERGYTTNGGKFVK